MKSYRLFFLLAFLFTGLSTQSCKNFLDENASSIMTENNFYKTEADAEAAVTAAYDGLNDQWNIYYRGIYLLAELATDNAECGQGVANANIFALDGFTFGPVNDRIYTLYTSLYKTIKDANVAIEKIPGINFNEAKKNRLIGEARFIRALLYYHLVRLFGDVPLVLKQPASLNEVDIARTPVQEVYVQIIADATFAEQYLDVSNSTDNTGRATQVSAKALLADVYLTNKQYDKARDKAKEILTLPDYGLVTNYFDVFTPENRFNKELLFAIQNKGLTGTSNGFAMALYLPRSTIPLSGGGTVGGNSADVPTEEFYNSFLLGDLRRDRTFFTKYNAGAGEVSFRPHWYKYFDPSAISNLGEGNLNYAVFRYADALLIYAEALNELSGPTDDAYNAINQVRRRAFGKALNQPAAAVDLSGLTKQGFQEAVLNERRWEFGFEDRRWYDLVRTGKLISTIKAKGNDKIKPYHVLFPLPQRELDVNKLLTQNEGYTN